MKCKRSRIIGMDVFRIFMAFLIFLYHSQTSCNYGVLQPFVKKSAVAMSGFFLLSGYSLYLGYCDKDLLLLTNLKNFYKKRLLSILPLYYLSYVIYHVFIAKDFLSDIAFTPIDILGMQIIYGESTFTRFHNVGMWFVSCILILYLVFPFLCEVIKQLREKTKILLIIIASAILLYSPILEFWFDLPSIYDNPFIRGLEFLIGILICSCKKDDGSRVISKIMYSRMAIIFEVLFLIGGITFCSRINLHLENDICNTLMLYNWLTLPVFILLIISLSGYKFNFSYSKIIKYLSDISYAFFLSQLWIFNISGNIYYYYSIDNNVIKILIAIIVCLISAILLHELFEKPITKKFLKNQTIGEK